MERMTFLLNAHGIFSDVNDATAHLFGVSAKELVGKRLDAFVSEQSGPRFLDAMLASYRGHPMNHVRAKIIPRGGSSVDVDMSFQPLKTDPQSAVPGIRVTVKNK